MAVLCGEDLKWLDRKLHAACDIASSVVGAEGKTQVKVLNRLITSERERKKKHVKCKSVLWHA